MTDDNQSHTSTGASNDDNQHSSENDTVQQAKNSLNDCLFSQYAATFAGVSGGTAYSLWKKPKNGIAIMVVAGTMGSLLEIGTGWFVHCRDHVEHYHQQKIKDRERKIKELEKRGITLESIQKSVGDSFGS